MHLLCHFYKFMHAAFTTSFISSWWVLFRGRAFPAVNKGAGGGGGGQNYFLRELVLNWRDAVYHTCHGQKLITCMCRMF